MTMARHRLVREGQSGVYHCMVRCVRRAFLCGEDRYSGKNYDHRKEWVRSRLEKLAGAYAVDVLAYAVMSNHLHVILRTRPERATTWSAEKVARQWLSVYTPKHPDESGEKAVHEVRDGDVALLLSDAERMEELRGRLSNLSWFMKSLNEHISRRANREDDCTGRFWESRFKCQRLDDEAGILMCMCYVDLNPVRSKLTESLEDYPFTSIYDRIMAARAEERRCALAEKTRGRRVDAQRLKLERKALEKCRERAKFLTPLEGEGSPFSRWTQGDYFRVLDLTGRELRKDKPGVISEEVRPLLESLRLDPEEWVESLLTYRKRFGLVAGTLDSLRKAAREAGSRWLKGCRACEGVFLPPGEPPPKTA